MQITEHTGDLLEANEPVLIHGCNAQGAMGAGFALALKRRHPWAFRAYREAYLLRGLRLGEVIWAINVVSGDQPRIIGNAITQEHYGRDAKRYVDYEAVRKVMWAVDEFCRRSHTDIRIPGLTPIRAVGMPMIGAGLAGGDWQTIAGIIEAETHHFEPVVYRLR